MQEGMTPGQSEEMAGLDEELTDPTETGLVERRVRDRMREWADENRARLDGLISTPEGKRQAREELDQKNAEYWKEEKQRIVQERA